MSKAVEDAIRARQDAQRPAPPPVDEPAPKKSRRPKVDVEAATEALAQLEEQREALTVSEGEDPGFTVTVERDSDDDRTFEVPSS